ncbi:MAG: type II toxin-antitoxin system RelE/ParE family toxin [Proteobacteria bacterium]|nr:type II toxin-antitoxin system RelE/ParE family toxin [Pseudomonadota bacterium]
MLDELLRLEAGNKQEKGLANKMFALLKQWVPGRMQGPQTHNENISKHLSGKVYEFKKGQKKGPKIRVLWFYGNRRQVICTACFLKTNKVPQSLIDKAEDLSVQFKDDLAAGNIEIIGE